MDFNVYEDKNHEKRVKITATKPEETEVFSVEDYNILTDSDGFEFIPIPNYRDKKYLLFYNRIKDAVDEVLHGYGDIVLTGNRANVFSCSITVARYLDREYGERIKAENIEKYSHYKFGYAVSKASESFGPSLFIGYNYELAIPYDKIRIFDNKEDAEKYISEFWDKLRDFNKKYEEIISINDPELLHVLLKNTPRLISINRMKNPIDNPEFLEVSQIIKKEK